MSEIPATLRHLAQICRVRWSAPPCILHRMTRAPAPDARTTHERVRTLKRALEPD